MSNRDQRGRFQSAPDAEQQFVDGFIACLTRQKYDPLRRALTRSPDVIYDEQLARATNERLAAEKAEVEARDRLDALERERQW